MRPYNPSGSFVGMNAYGNLGNHQRNLHGSTNEIYRSSTNISFDNEKRTGVNESYRFSQANGSRNEVVTERYSTTNMLTSSNYILEIIAAMEFFRRFE